MLTRLLPLGLSLAAMTLAAPADAGESPPEIVPTIVSKSGQNDNKVFVGLNWNFGVRDGLTAVAGFRWTHSNGGSHVDGALVDLTVPLTGASLGIGEVHLKGLTGSRSTQAELGGGYAFQAQSWLLNGGLRVPYGNAGADYIVDKGWQPYIGIDSLKKARAGSETRSCPPPYFFNSAGTCELD